MTVMVTAADQHEEANAQRDEAENPDFNGANSVPDVDEFDLSEFAVELEAVAGGGASDSEAEDPDDDDGATAHGAAPPGAPPASALQRRMQWQRRRARARRKRHLAVLAPDYFDYFDLEN